MKKRTNNTKYWLWALGLNFFCAFIVFLPFIITNGGLISLSNDFNAQEIAFNMFANKAIKSGEILWNWNIDLGSDFISTFSFYNLGSPFFWITLLFPAKIFPYLMPWVYMLKYAIAGLTSYLYISRFAKKQKIAVISSVLYAFSGFQAANLVFYHFHDVVALFPLLLLGMEIMMEEGKKGVFAIAVFVNTLLNYFFFFGEVIFIVIYFVVKFLLIDKKNWKKVPQCIIEGALGVGMAGILFVPSCFTILNNTRISNKLSGKDMFFFVINDYFANIKAFILPGDNMAVSTSVSVSNWYSVAAYLPLVGLLLVIAYMVKNKKSWLSRILLICVALVFIPIFNNMFVLFNVEPYRRWYYMPVLMMALASEQVLENRKKYTLKIETLVMSILLVVFGLAVLYKRHSTGDVNWLTSPRQFVAMEGIAIIGMIATYVLCKYFNESLYTKGLLISITGMSILTMAFTMYSYRHCDMDHVSTQDVYNDVVEGSAQLETDTLPYRYRFWENYYNRGLSGYLTTRNTFCTTVSNSIFEFYDALGTHRHTIGVEGPDGTDELLGVGYSVSDVYDSDKNLTKQYNDGSKEVYVYDVRTTSIGYSYDTYITKSEFDKLDSEVRACAMLKSLVVADEDEEMVNKLLKHDDSTAAGQVSTDEKKQYVESHLDEQISGFHKTSTTFDADIKVNDSKYVYFSVPYDKQWKATVNGKDVPCLNINGMMALEVDAGENHIQFKYQGTYVYLGLMISALCVVLWISWSFVLGKKVKRKWK